MLKKSYCGAYQPSDTELSRRRKEDSKKTQKKQVDQSKQILNKKIKELEGKIDHLMESSKVLDEKSVDLVKDAENRSNQSVIFEEANALKREGKSQCEKLKQTLEVRKGKRNKS